MQSPTDPTGPMAVIAVMQPWADWLVPDANVHRHLRGGHHRSGADRTAGQLPKDVENRPAGTRHRGLLAIHAMLQADTEVIERLRLGPASWFLRGVIVGVVDLVDVVTDSASPWAQKDRTHWVVANPRRLLTPVPNRGYQGIRNLDESAPAAAAEVRRQLTAGLYTTLERAAA